MLDVDVGAGLDTGGPEPLPPTDLATLTTLDLRFVNDAGVVRDHFRIVKPVHAESHGGQDDAWCGGSGDMPQPVSLTAPQVAALSEPPGAPVTARPGPGAAATVPTSGVASTGFLLQPPSHGEGGGWHAANPEQG